MLNSPPGASEADFQGARPAAARVHAMKGNDPDRWVRDLRTWSSVRLEQAYPGIGLDLEVRGGNIEELFHLAPGADPGDIRLRVDGIEALSVDADGRLVASAGGGDVRFSRPVAYQERSGERRSVQVSYDVSGREYGFAWVRMITASH